MKINFRRGVVGLTMLSLFGASLALTAPAQAQTLGKIYGVAFIDSNANGKRDPGESTTLGRFKVTGGGAFWRCGHTGRDNTYGIMVRPGTYFVMPIAGPGQHTSTPVIRVQVPSPGSAVQADLPLVPQPLAVAENCGEYAPKRTARVPWGIPETAVAKGFTTLVRAIDAAGLFDTLSGPGPFTVFAPNDLAFAQFTEEELNTILADRDLLRSVLTYHVVPGRLKASDVAGASQLTTVNGKTLTVQVKDGEVFVGDARVIATDIEAANGVVHVIDTVLVP
ncbi:MAG: fasciclin domain-containing protein [Thermoflexales bacterium]|nr:fasciclin domain-containing protein [Thermoflexales bacterium]MDW8350433.1 fasciclin domain-containing protein [Anaerolineae bacterium]